jgi:hypothetical protein
MGAQGTDAEPKAPSDVFKKTENEVKTSPASHNVALR